jgi:hypothetical protein
MVTHQIPAEARIEMFLDGPTIDRTTEDIARRVINRSPGSTGPVQRYAELDDSDPQQLTGVWLAVVFWFGIKSGLLHQRAAADRRGAAAEADLGGPAVYRLATRFSNPVASAV